MGSFNTTCMISKAPITRGQRVRLLFLMPVTKFNSGGLENNNFQGVQCYPYDNFDVVGMPLKATYNDYNRYIIDDSDKELADITLRCINQKYIPNKVQEGYTIEDYNEYHDYMNIDLITSLEQAQEMEHSGALRIEELGTIHPLCKVAIHEDVFNYTLDFVDHRGNDLNKINKQLTNIIESKNLLSYMYDYCSSGFFEVCVDKNNLEKGLLRISEQIVFTKWMQEYNFEYMPCITSDDTYDYHKHTKTLTDINSIISKMYVSNEDMIPVKSNVVFKNEVSIKELNQTLEDWRESKISDKISKLNIKVGDTFTIGDGSTIDKLQDKHDLFYALPNGTIIEFIE